MGRVFQRVSKCFNPNNRQLDNGGLDVEPQELFQHAHRAIRKKSAESHFSTFSVSVKCCSFFWLGQLRSPFFIERLVPTSDSSAAPTANLGGGGLVSWPRNRLKEKVDQQSWDTLGYVGIPKKRPQLSKSSSLSLIVFESCQTQNRFCHVARFTEQ